METSQKNAGVYSAFVRGVKKRKIEKFDKWKSSDKTSHYKSTTETKSEYVKYCNNSLLLFVLYV